MIGTEKQVKCAEEIKANQMKGIFETINGFKARLSTAREGTGKERYAEMIKNYEEKAAEVEKIEDAGWWIENKNNKLIMLDSDGKVNRLA